MALSVAAILVLFVAVFSWNRWLRFDDEADIQGVWVDAAGGAQLAFDDRRMLVGGQVAYDYVLDTQEKTISYSFGDASGFSAYRFNESRDVLVLDEQAHTDWLMALHFKEDPALEGGEVPEGSIKLTRTAPSAAAEFTAYDKANASAQAHANQQANPIDPFSGWFDHYAQPNAASASSSAGAAGEGPGSAEPAGSVHSASSGADGAEADTGEEARQGATGATSSAGGPAEQEALELYYDEVSGILYDATTWLPVEMDGEGGVPGLYYDEDSHTFYDTTTWLPVNVQTSSGLDDAGYDAAQAWGDGSQAWNGDGQTWGADDDQAWSTDDAGLGWQDTGNVEWQDASTFEWQGAEDAGAAWQNG